MNYVSVPTIGDGSCFFHSIFMAVSSSYQKANTYNRKKMVVSFRRDLSKIFQSQKQGSDKSWYEYLGNGNLASLGVHPMEYYVKQLDSSSWVGNEYQELVSEVLDIDIYIIDLKKSKALGTLYPYIAGDDISCMYKGRLSVLVGASPGHYQTLGVRDPKLRLIFDPSDRIIMEMKIFFSASA